MTAMKDRFAVGLTAEILRFAQDDKASFFFDDHELAWRPEVGCRQLKVEGPRDRQDGILVRRNMTDSGRRGAALISDRDERLFRGQVDDCDPSLRSG
jgi:hypothetical protein